LSPYRQAFPKRMPRQWTFKHVDCLPGDVSIGGLAVLHR
jgi:hypothetical protein